MSSRKDQADEERVVDETVADSSANTSMEWRVSGAAGPFGGKAGDEQ